MSKCPLNKPCDKPKNISLLVMEGKNEETIFVCSSCPLARQIETTTEAENCCAVCKSTYENIKSTSKLGCDFCYLFMNNKIKKIIEKVQNGATKHNGKKPHDKAKLLQKFFSYALEKYQTENPEEIENCNKLKKILTRYF